MAGWRKPAEGRPIFFNGVLINRVAKWRPEAAAQARVAKWIIYILKYSKKKNIAPYFSVAI